MPESAIPELPRVALVFGNEAAAAHVREAISGCAEIVYAASAREFDAARLASTGAAAALLNLDGGDWLDRIETTLNASGVKMVFNDPEVSRTLDGWERARWVRHLVAKLGGGRDVDPPRPEAAPAGAVPAATAPVMAAAEVEPPLPAAADASPEPGASPAGAGDATPDADELLDVDTETLSAMIDARLAQPESRSPSDSPEVWRVVSEGAQQSAPSDTVDAEPAAVVDSGVAPTGDKARDDSDVLADLPSLEDWRLVDPESVTASSPAAADEREAAAPVLSGALAALELVPMEAAAPVQARKDPVERWFGGKPGKSKANGSTGEDRPREARHGRG